MLKQYREKFQGGTFSVTWNYLKESMNTYLSQPNPVTARWESQDHLRDPKFQLDAFRVSIMLLYLCILLLPNKNCVISVFIQSMEKKKICAIIYDSTFMLQYRTSRLLQSVALRLRKHSKTLGSFGAWNRCLNHLLTLAESHIESVILANFVEAVQKYFLFHTLLVLSILVC